MAWNFLSVFTPVEEEPDLRVAGHQLSPLLPLRTLIPVIKGGLVGRPAALLVTVPEG